MSKRVKIICGGEPETTRQDRIQTEIMDYEAKLANQERHQRGDIVEEKDLLKRIAELEYTIKCFEFDYGNARREIKSLRGYKEAFEGHVEVCKRQEEEIKRLNQLLWGIAA